MRQLYVWKRAHWPLAVCVFMSLGCSTGHLRTGGSVSVPGQSAYCLSEVTNATFRASLKSSDSRYGAYKLGRLGGNTSTCDLTEFYTYTVTMERTDGRKTQLEFDLDALMRRLHQDHPAASSMTRHTSQPQLVVEYALNEVNIYYRVSQYQIDGMEYRNGVQVLTKPATVTSFHLLTSTWAGGLSH